MNAQKLNDARMAAYRFLSTTEPVLRELAQPNVPWWRVSTRLTAAVRRASMDLTRALADLRKPS